MADTDRSRLPGPAVSPWRRTLRYWVSRVAIAIITRAYLRLRLEGRERLPAGPAIYCFNHLSWADPFVLMAVLPFRPRLWFFGPKEEDMGLGGRNRLMFWTGTAIPYKPGKNDLLDATRRVGAVVATGSVVAIAGEGRIHVHETELLPVSEGAAYFALRSSVPMVPIAINGTSWLRFGGRIRIRVGEPIPIAGRPTREAVAEATALLTASLLALIADAPDVPPPGRVGRWVTERFNDWPEGSRDAAKAASEAAGLPYSKTSEPPWNRPNDTGGSVVATALSANAKEYRKRLTDQSDDQIDAWVAELMRDVVIRRGIPKVVEDFRRAGRLDERGFERVFASGGGPPAVIGHDANGRLVVPTITLYVLVPGLRAQVPDARDRLIEYLIENFDEIVYV